ncbi:hypothetical protein BH10ACI3_BH10ACI3_15260 [soil metagenome]
MSTTGRAYELTLTDQVRYLHAHLTSRNIDRVAALDQLAEIAVTLSDTRCKRILLERDTDTNVDDHELFGVIAEYVEMSPGIKAAFVNKNLAENQAIKYFAARSSPRTAEFKHFTDLKEAEAWLILPFEQDQSAI